ncbi:MAG: BrnT family toxin [Deltaproteobacteria bacterium]|nr:BrnT family toxin [Deltaproteobacteria bacterium]
MILEWDENKNRINKAKHGISFEMASTVFEDCLSASRLESEDHWQTIGHAEGGMLLLFVAHTYQEGADIVVRIISARQVTPHERKHYENGTF